MSVTAIHPEQITIRIAYPDDATALRALAQLDSSPVPAEPVLVAEVGGDVKAALSLRDGVLVADPFHPSEHLRVLLQVHAAQLGESPWGSAHRRRSAVRAASAVWRALAPRKRGLSPAPPLQPAPATARDAAMAASPRAFLRAS